MEDCGSLKQTSYQVAIKAYTLPDTHKLYIVRCTFCSFILIQVQLLHAAPSHNGVWIECFRVAPKHDIEAALYF